MGVMTRVTRIIRLTAIWMLMANIGLLGFQPCCTQAGLSAAAVVAREHADQGCCGGACDGQCCCGCSCGNKSAPSAEPAVPPVRSVEEQTSIALVQPATATVESGANDAVYPRISFMDGSLAVPSLQARHVRIQT